MNELESQNLHEYTIHQSVAVLVVKGTIAWLLMALSDFAFNRLLIPASYSGSTNLGFLTAESWFNFAINLAYGWLLLYIVLSWVFHYYIIKSESIVIRKGIFFTHEDVFQMEDVKTLDVYQGFWGKLLNTGSVQFYAFRAQKHVHLSSIHDPHKVAAFIHSLHQLPPYTTPPAARKKPSPENFGEEDDLEEVPE